MKTVSVYNLKGGVGKTATAVNLAYLAAADGLRTLLCDFDPQGSTSFYLRVRPPKRLKAKTLITGGKGLATSIRESDYEKLDLLPSAFSFRKLAQELGDSKNSKERIRKSLRRFRRDYDLLVIDAPPSIDLQAENILRASDLVVTPVMPTTLSRESYETVLAFAADKKIDPKRIRGFVSMVDIRKRLHREMSEQLLSQPGFFSVAVPYSSVVEQMGLTRAPVVLTHPRTKASMSFHLLWQLLSEELRQL